MPEEFGGAAMDHIAYTIVIEEISKYCASMGAILSVQNSLYCDPVYRYGTEEQKKKFLTPFASGGKNRVLRADRAAGGFERGGAEDESRAEWRQVCGERHEGLDHQWRARRTRRWFT